MKLAPPAALAVMTLLVCSAQPAHAQVRESLRARDLPKIVNEKRPDSKRSLRVGERMSSSMLKEIQRFKGVSAESAMVLLNKQARLHMIVMSQCDFELKLSRQNATPSWQALTDSVARDARRIVLARAQLTAPEINDVLGRAARMAQACMAWRETAY